MFTDSFKYTKMAKVIATFFVTGELEKSRHVGNFRNERFNHLSETKFRVLQKSPLYIFVSGRCFIFVIVYNILREIALY